MRIASLIPLDGNCWTISQKENITHRTGQSAWDDNVHRALEEQHSHRCSGLRASSQQMKANPHPGFFGSPGHSSQQSHAPAWPSLLERPWDTERVSGFDTGALGLFHEPDTLLAQFIGSGRIGGGVCLFQLFEGLISLL